MPDWIPIFAMPNVRMHAAVEVEGIAIVPYFDPRLRAVASAHPQFEVYLKQFKTEFGRPVEPSFIIVREDMPSIYRRVDALSSFRDALSIAVMTRGWAMAFKHGRGGYYGPRWANTFTFYPWMMDKNYNGLITNSMMMLGYEDDASHMSGQSTAGVAVTRMVNTMVDEVLLEALLRRWKRRYSGRSPSWQDRALFRSLNMANAAAMLPAHAEITNLDIGRHTSLWVSAFEILAHPKKGDSGFLQVYELLERNVWQLHHNRNAIYPAYKGRKGTSQRVLPCWVYGELNHARNDFLHGNPIRPARLTTPRSKRGLFFYAWPLYRLALTPFLNLQFKRKKPKPSDAAGWTEYVSAKMDFDAYQGDIEAGLSSIKYTEREWEDIRNGRLKPTAVRRPY